MGDIIISGIIVAAGAALLFWLQKSFSVIERRYLWAGLFGFFGGALFKIWLIVEYYGGTGDMMMYQGIALELMQLIQRDPATYGPEIMRILFQVETQTGLEIFGYGTSTGSMSAVLALAFYVFGDSLYTASILFAALSFFGSLGMYRAVRQLFGAEYRTALLWACVLLPSGIFWTAGFSKELFATAGLGVLVYGLYLAFERRRRLTGIPVIVVGAGLVTLFKPFILIGCFAAFGAYYYAVRQQRLQTPSTQTLKPVYMALALCVAVVGFIAVGEVFPRFSIDQLAEEIAAEQEGGARGGSAIEMGDPTERSLAGQLVFAPLALTNSLFRPFLFEVHNVVSLANGLEMTVLTLLLLIALKRVGPIRSFRLVMRSPVLLASFVLVLIMGVGVGLATANIGTLSRYRSPMMPFWVMIIGVLYVYGKEKMKRDRIRRQEHYRDIAGPIREVE